MARMSQPFQLLTQPEIAARIRACRDELAARRCHFKEPDALDAPLRLLEQFKYVRRLPNKRLAPARSLTPSKSSRCGTVVHVHRIPKIHEFQAGTINPWISRIVCTPRMVVLKARSPEWVAPMSQKNRTPPRRFHLILEGRDDLVPVIVRLRRLLKSAGRSFGLKVVRATEVVDEQTSSVNTKMKETRSTTR
jgi:hypothetical protein